MAASFLPDLVHFKALAKIPLDDHSYAQLVKTVLTDTRRAKNFFKAKNYQTNLRENSDIFPTIEAIASDFNNYSKELTGKVLVIYASGITLRGKVPIPQVSGDETSLDWVELGSEIAKRCAQKQVGKIVLVMDVLEIGTNQNARRGPLSHNHPDFYPMKVKDIKKVFDTEIYEMQMVTHEVREKTWKLKGSERGSYFTELLFLAIDKELHKLCESIPWNERDKNGYGSMKHWDPAFFSHS